MSKWSDSDMDKLFQDGSKKYDFEYNPEAWEQMDTLLGQQERRRRVAWWLNGGIAVILAVAVISFFIFDKNIDTTNEAHSEKEIATNVEKPKITDIQKDKNTNQSPSTANDTGLKVQENGLGKTSQQAPNLPVNGEGQGARFQQGPERSVLPSRTPMPKKTTSAAVPPSQIAKSERDEMLAEDVEILKENFTSVENGRDENGELPDPEGTAVPLQFLPKKLPLPAIQLFPRNDLPTLKLPALNPKKIEPKKNDALLIGLSGAAEFNSVGQGDYSEMNWKYGLHLEYRFKKRLALRTGASYIHMWYDAGEDEYEPGSFFWVDGIAPESTRGQCNMLEIPLHLSYHFKGYGNDGFFASAGVASYIILEEHYWYKYETPPTDPIRYWGTFDDERNWLNIGYFSGGYHKNLSKKLSMQVGPYMQLPLTGIGHGHVKIYSVGVQAVANFKVK